MRVRPALEIEREKELFFETVDGFMRPIPLGNIALWRQKDTDNVVR